MAKDKKPSVFKLEQKIQYLEITINDMQYSYAERIDKLGQTTHRLRELIRELKDDLAESQLEVLEQSLIIMDYRKVMKRAFANKVEKDFPDNSEES